MRGSPVTGPRGYEPHRHSPFTGEPILQQAAFFLLCVALQVAVKNQRSSEKIRRDH